MTNKEYDYYKGLYALSAESKAEDCRKLYENSKESYERVG